MQDSGGDDEILNPAKRSRYAPCKPGTQRRPTPEGGLARWGFSEQPQERARHLLFKCACFGDFFGICLGSPDYSIDTTGISFTSCLQNSMVTSRESLADDAHAGALVAHDDVGSPRTVTRCPLAMPLRPQASA